MAVKAAAAPLSLKPNGITKRVDTNKGGRVSCLNPDAERAAMKNAAVKVAENEADMKSSDRDFSSFFFI